MQRKRRETQAEISLLDFIGNSFMSRKVAKAFSLGVFATLREIPYRR